MDDLEQERINNLFLTADELDIINMAITIIHYDHFNELNKLYQGTDLQKKLDKLEEKIGDWDYLLTTSFGRFDTNKLILSVDNESCYMNLFKFFDKLRKSDETETNKMIENASIETRSALGRLLDVLEKEQSDKKSQPPKQLDLFDNYKD